MQSDLNLGVIGNCTFAALVDTRARIVWSCMPRFDGDPVFCSLLRNDTCMDDQLGVFEMQIEGFARSEQGYLRNTAILRTLLHDEQGRAMEVIDFAPRFSHFGRRHRPTVLIRIVRAVEGRPRVRVRMKPMFDYGATAPTLTHGSNHIRYVGTRQTLRLTTNAPLSFVLGETWFYLEQPIAFFLGPDESLTRPVAETAREFMENTAAYWREWVRHLAVPFEWQEAVIRAAITLKLCWFEETGAIVAAMTTSIPEAANSGRNWDYRYCWLRDAYFVVQALNRLGAIDIMEGYLAYLRNLVGVADGGHLQPVYGIGLESTLVERVEPGLVGYRGMAPVRVGNQAYEHLQHDVYGQVVLSAAQAFFDQRLLRPVGEQDFVDLEKVGERAYSLYDQPDAGLWELRTRSKVHTYSSIMCWAACDRLGRIAGHLGMPERAELWRARAQEIRAAVLERAWDEARGWIAESFGGSDLDASLLLMAELGFLPADDPRFAGTVDAIAGRLRRGNHLFRYVTADDFGLPENAFNICTFWYIEALAAMGRRAEAREIFNAMLECRNHVGLLSEDIATESGELWGNYPQTYSLVGIIHGAMRLSRPWEAGR